MKNKLLLLSFLLTSLAAAAEPAPPCHRLLTERECSEHHAALATLQPGAALDRYLGEYARTRKEREASCNAAHARRARIIVLNTIGPAAR